MREISGSSTVGSFFARWLIIAIALFGCNCAEAEVKVYLLRGWFGVFSTGLDTMADELRSKGVKAEAIGHRAWRSAVSSIVKDREAGATYRLALVGHSQGANNVIEMARALRAYDIPVDLLITLVAYGQDQVPSNVARAINYYQSPGWGSPLVADADFKGELSNVNVASDWAVFHINIDKSAKIQAEVVKAIMALPP